MKVGDKLTFEFFDKGHRPFIGVAEFVNAIRRTVTVMSWGAHAWTKSEYALRFMVQGHHHRGHVYVAVNGSDLFDVYLTSSQGKIKQIITDVYLEDFIDLVDRKVERIDEYVN